MQHRIAFPMTNREPALDVLWALFNPGSVQDFSQASLLGQTPLISTLGRLTTAGGRLGSVALRNSVPLARRSKPLRLRAVRVRTIDVVLHDTTRVQSRPTAEA